MDEEKDQVEEKDPRESEDELTDEDLSEVAGGYAPQKPDGSL